MARFDALALSNASQIIPHLTNEIQDWIEGVSKLPVDETDEEENLGGYA